MPFIDVDNTDIDDLPEHMRPDPYCVWVWIVAPNTNHSSVCFEKEMAAEIQEAKSGDVEIKRTRLWFKDEQAEKEVNSVLGAGYDE